MDNATLKDQEELVDIKHMDWEGTDDPEVEA